jgi:hypothetical protein
MEKHYLVLNGDIIGSRELNEDARQESMNKLQQVCNKLNSKFSGAISGDFYIGGRDSIQGVLRNAEKLLEVLDQIKTIMLPYKLRYGIGYGIIDTYGTTMTAEMEGEAFDYATDSIVQTRVNQNRIIFMSGNEKLDSEINEILKDIKDIRDRWSEDEYNQYLNYDFESNNSNENKVFKNLRATEQVLVETLKKI